jgi:hypothetical protein
MIQVLAQTLEAADEANARHLFDVFETLLILVRHHPMLLFSHLIICAGDTPPKSAYPSTSSLLHSSRL